MYHTVYQYDLNRRPPKTFFSSLFSSALSGIVVVAVPFFKTVVVFADQKKSPDMWVVRNLKVGTFSTQSSRVGQVPLCPS